MASSYPRKFNVGRGSELLYNEELHKNFEATKHLLDVPEDTAVPITQLDGALWLKREKGLNELKTWVKNEGRYVNIFANKFQIVDQITNTVIPPNPVPGQLWIYHDVLSYYDGNKWRPIKSLPQSAGQFDLSIFNDYMFVSPLWKHGSTVIKDDDIIKFLELRRKYLQGKIDLINDSTLIAQKRKWKIGDKVDIDELTLNNLKIEGRHQFVVPNIEYERIFLDDSLDFKYEKINEFTINYEKKLVLEKTPTLIHVNPASLCGIKKRLFRIDRRNPRVRVSPFNTEYYGFKIGDRHGSLLLPESSQDDGGYILDKNNGIILSRNQAQNYDYVLSVTFIFDKRNPVGTMNYVNDKQKTTSYYIPDFLGSNNVFVEGLVLEGTHYSEDGKSKTITIDDDTSKMEVQIMRSGIREYGYVREITVEGKAVVKVIYDYRRPQVFMNGQAMNMDTEVTYDKANNTFFVLGGQHNMSWVVIELCDKQNPIKDADGDYITLDNKKAGFKTVTKLTGEKIQEGPYKITGKAPNGDPIFDEHTTVDIKYYDMYDSSGAVTLADNKGNAVIKYDNDDVRMQDRYNSLGYKIGEYADCLVLFVDGLMIKQDDLIVDLNNKTVRTSSLRKGQEYVLLKDKYHYFMNMSSLMPALYVDKVSDSLVYHNGKLICNGTAITRDISKERMKEFAVHNEIIHFTGESLFAVKDIMEFNANTNEWVQLPRQVRLAIFDMINSYENMPKTIAFNFEWSKQRDRMDVYAFKFANDIDNTLIIKNLPTTYNDPDSAIDNKNKPLPYVMTGDAPEIAANRIHFFEKDIKDMINSLPESFTKQFPMDKANMGASLRAIREEAIRRLNNTPKYSTLHYHKFDIEDKYMMGIGSLCVYVNGVRQLWTIETGENSFAIPWPVRGLVTYTIEAPLATGNIVAQREILDHNNTIDGIINTYKTSIPLYPGRVNVYVDGVRQGKDTFHIIDSHTIMFKDSETKLTGEKSTYPDEIVVDYKNIPVKIHHTEDSKILIEVFSEIDWKEKDFYLKRSLDNYIIAAQDYNLDLSALHSLDHLKIYIDGLYMGLKDHDGYVCDRNKETITVTRPTVIDKITGDPLYLYLMRNKHANEAYKKEQNERRIMGLMKRSYNMTREKAIKILKDQGLYDEDRMPYRKNIIIEWR